jgi:tetratricopeptide (TPR) repeat protein
MSYALSVLYIILVRCASTLNTYRDSKTANKIFWGDTLINLKQELQNYPPINLKSIEENTPDIPDDIKNSIILYNKALDSIRFGSEDIAIIELKKVLSMNPNFYEAMNLLGVCYAYTKDFDKASEVFKRVAAAESNGVKAQEYLTLLNSGHDTLSSPKTFKRRSIVQKSGTKSKVESVDTKPVSLESKNLRKGGIFRYVACAAIGALVVLLAMLPAIFGRSANEEALNALNAEKEVLNEKLATFESDYKMLEQRNESLQNDLETANASTDYYKACIKLYEAKDLFSERNYEAAADMLLLIRTVDFKEEDKERFDKLNNDVMPAAANAAFNEGYRLFSIGKYQEALERLNKIQIYKHDYESVDRVLYYIGKCYMELNDSRNAVATFQKIISTYPQSKYSGYSKLRLDELTRIP